MWGPGDTAVLQSVGSALAGPGPPNHHQLSALLNATRDIPGYLGAVILSATPTDTALTNAAFLLKTLVANPAYAGDSWLYARDAVLTGLLRNGLSHHARAALAGVLAKLVLAADVWPALADAIRTGIHPDAAHGPRDGIMLALEFIAEDCPRHNHNILGLWALGPRLIELVEHRQHAWRRALRTVAHTGLYPDAPDRHAQAILSVLTDHAVEHDAKIDALQTLVATAPDFVAVLHRDQVNALVTVMLQASNTPDHRMALAAVEFWIPAHNHKFIDPMLSTVAAVLPELVQILLDAMIYSQEETIQLQDEANQDDRPEDIAPHLAHQKNALFAWNNNKTPQTLTHNEEISTLQNTSASSPSSSPSDSLSDDYTFEDAFDQNKTGPPDQWTLRKAAATALDRLATIYSAEMLPIILPLLYDRFSAEPQRWQPREAAVLALGAIAPGCYQGVIPHMPTLAPYLVRLLQDQSPMVRSISSWTLSRYAQWIISQSEGISLLQNEQQIDGQKLFQQMLKSTLDNLMHENKLVQAAAGSALAALIEDSQEKIAEYVSPILSSVALALPKYQPKNTLVLYDVLTTLARTAGSDFATQEAADIVVPLLLAKWNSVPDDSLAILPLCECLSSVFSGMGPVSQSIARPVYDRTCGMLERALLRPQEAAGPYDADIIVCTMELVIGMIEGLGVAMEPLVTQSNILHALYMALKEPYYSINHNIQQSALSLLGELAKCGTHTLMSAIPEYAPFVIQAVDTENPSYTCNNAIWALGEIAVYVGQTTAATSRNNEKDAVLLPIVDQSLQRLISIVNQRQLHRSILENAAITLGRLGMVLPEFIAPKLTEFAGVMCMSLRNTRDDIEKEQAFRGLCAMTKLNPSGIVEHFAYFCDAVGSWYHIRPDLEHQFSHILNGYKNSMGPGWNLYFETFPPALRGTMQQRYGL